MGTTERVPLKHLRVMKKRGKVESKSRDCESAFEKFSDPAGIPSSSKLEANVEHAQTEKNSYKSHHFGDFRKVRSWLEPSIFEHFCRDPPAERLSSSFPPASSAPGSAHVKNRDKEIGKASKSQSTVMDSVLAPLDILLLYWTLVKDGVLPRGYESQFGILETAIVKGARRALKRTAGSDNFKAAVWLHQRNLQSQQKQHSERLAVDQFLLAALDRPSKFSARLQEKYNDGPNARRDAEEALRTKWLQELEALLMGTKTLMGEVLSNRQGDRSFLGGGRRASRARVRAPKKYLAWPAVSADVAFPSEVSHLTGFLESRHSEPCNRGALRAAHQCMVFLEDVAGIDEKLTTNALYTVVCRELLATAQPGRTPRQAPRYPVAVLESLEELVLSESATFFLRVYVWWLLLQCWGTLRFQTTEETVR